MKIEIYIYPDRTCYYNYNGKSYDFKNPLYLKKDIKEKFNYTLLLWKMKKEESTSPIKSLYIINM